MRTHREPLGVLQRMDLMPAGMAAAVVLVVLAVEVSALQLLLLLLVVAPLLFAIVRRPQVGLLVLVAAAPFDGLSVVIPQVSAGLKFALLAVVTVASFVCPSSARRSAPSPLPEVILPVVGLLALGVLSAGRVGPLEVLVGLKVAFVYLFAAVTVWRCPLATVERDRLVTILMVTGFVTSLYGIVQQALGPTQLHDRFGYPYNDVIRFASGDFFRSFSTFKQSPSFGLFLMVVLLIGLPVSLSDPRRLRNAAFLYVLPVFGVALLFSFARTALVGLAVGLLYLGFRRYHLLLAGLALVVAGMIAFAGPLAEPIGSTTSLGERASGWSDNLSQVRAHPLGVGIGVTGSAAETVNMLSGGAADDRYQPDNYYFKTVYELGLVGLWFLVALYAVAIRAAARAAASGGADQGLLDGITATMLAAMAASFFSSYLEIFPMDLMFWLFLGIVATMSTSGRRPLRATAHAA